GGGDGGVGREGWGGGRGPGEEGWTVRLAGERAGDGGGGEGSDEPMAGGALEDPGVSVAETWACDVPFGCGPAGYGSEGGRGGCGHECVVEGMPGQSECPADAGSAVTPGVSPPQPERRRVGVQVGSAYERGP